MAVGTVEFMLIIILQNNYRYDAEKAITSIAISRNRLGKIFMDAEEGTCFSMKLYPNEHLNLTC